MHTPTKPFILLAVLALFQFTQVIAQSNQTAFSYPPTILPDDVTQLWANDGNPNSDTVIIICQGGPAKHLKFIEKGKTSYRYLPNYANYHIAYLHQAQTFNQKMFDYQDEFTIEMAEKEVENTTEILYRTLTYFKSQNKTIIVIGTSYGAYIIENYLSKKSSLADQYVIIAGRVDDNEQMLQQHLRGFNGSFKKNGKTYIPEDETADLSQYSEAELKEYRVRQLLKGAIGKPKYSQLLADKDLSNVTYFYAKNDQNVGRLTDAEIEFLESKKVKIFATKSGHSETLYRFIDLLDNGTLKL